jgi:N-acetylated-alpha-linked acidic dipeptidase
VGATKIHQLGDIMRNSIIRVLLVCLSSNAILAQSVPTAAMLGFSDETFKTQRVLEEKFDSTLKNDNLRDWMKRLSARPHHVGSAL